MELDSASNAYECTDAQGAPRSDLRGERRVASLRAVDRWDHEVDVLVIGAGLAGCTTTIAARQADPECEVLLIDKLTGGLYGGASRCAGQYLNCPEPGDVGDLMAYQRALNEPFSIPESLLETWATAVCNNRPWIAALAANAGSELVVKLEQDPDFPALPGSDVVRRVWSIGEPGKSGVWETFRANAEQLGVQLMIGTPAHALVQDPDTLEVFGALATRTRDGRSRSARGAAWRCASGAWRPTSRCSRSTAAMTPCTRWARRPIKATASGCCSAPGRTCGT